MLEKLQSLFPNHYRSDRTLLINADCMEVMKHLKENEFDLACVDPPYGIDVGQQRINSNRKTKKWANPSPYEYKVFDDSAAPDKKYFENLARVSREQIIWGANYFVENIPASKGWIVWDKRVDEKEHLSMCELAYSSFDVRLKKYEFLWAGFKKQEQETRIHPTQKPVKLYEWLLTNYAKPGQRILDTHSGSGSSAIAAHYFGCDFVGCEIDKDYYESAIERFINETRQLALM